MKKINKKNLIIISVSSICLSAVAITFYVIGGGHIFKPIAKGAAGCPAPVPDHPTTPTTFIDWLNAGDYCILENDEFYEGINTSWASAAARCSDFGGRLCTSAEWVAACNSVLLAAITDFTDGKEFTGDIMDTPEFEGVVAGNGGAGACGSLESYLRTGLRTGDPGSARPLTKRCCANKL